MSQQDMDRTAYLEARVGELHQKIGDLRGELERERASRRDWAAIAMAHDMAAEFRAVGTLDDPWPEPPAIGAPCSCLTPEQAAVVLAGGFSLPLCAVHPEAEDAALLAVAEARVAVDTGERHNLDDVAREFGVDLGGSDG